VLIVVMIMMITIMIAAAPSYFFQLLTALTCLMAVFTVAVNCIAQFVLRLMNLPFTSFVSVVIGPQRKRRAHQSNQRQQCNAKHSEGTSHKFSFKWGFYDLSSLAQVSRPRSEEIRSSALT
jgi:hypothetical protein